ncbi:uncharacterized protein [Clytia hemisphaerica]|uniref:uncharacterized protein isoform X2 n=1 Tax=Clytia hemisphaerica TaxID=252671 RepID=UPI0034D51105
MKLKIFFNCSKKSRKKLILKEFHLERFCLIIKECALNMCSCNRLELKSLAYLWQRNQDELLDEMIAAEVTAILIKVASLGLKPCHLGQTLHEMRQSLHRMKKECFLNVCGEGGEYETLVLDCPLFIKTIVIDESTVVTHEESNDVLTVAYKTFQKFHLREKLNVNSNMTLRERMKGVTIATPPLLNVHVPQLCSNDQQEKDNADVICTRTDVPKSKDCCFSFRSNKTVGWVSGIVCPVQEDKTLEESTLQVLNTFKEKLEEHCGGQDENNPINCLVHLFVRNMDDFARINNVYKRFFKAKPPARVCVKVELPPNEHFRMDTHLVNQSQRQVHYVQGISYWAPANIGPYSQAVKCTIGRLKKVFFSGSIPLQPASMQLLTDDFPREAMLSLKHVHEVAEVFANERHSNVHYGSITCYVTQYKFMKMAQNIFEHHQDFFPAENYEVGVVCVPRLPRNARIEWHVNMVIPLQQDEDCSEDEDGQDETEDVVNDVSRYFKNSRVFSLDNPCGVLREVPPSKDAPFCRLFVAIGDTASRDQEVKEATNMIYEQLKPKTIVSIVPVTYVMDGALMMLSFDFHS